MTFSPTFSRSALLVVALATACPAFAQVTVNTETSRNKYRWSSSTGVTDFNIELRGSLELTDDDKDVRSMSDDGYLEITKTVFGSRRTIIIESAGGGKVRKQYYEGRTEMKWEPDGRSWLAEILPDIVRNTTIGAESRVKRFFSKGGVDAVMEEITRIDSDHVKHHYGNVLMKLQVPIKAHAAIVRRLSEEMDSDHFIASFLKENLDKFLASREGTTAVFAATREMDSDYYKTVVIKEALRGHSASAENVKVILGAAGEMESDHFITEVLKSLLDQGDLSDAVLTELINTTRSIESDHYQTVVLTRAMEKPNLSAAAHAMVIEAIKDIESDHYLTEVIKQLLTAKLTDELLTLLLDITSSIESDHYSSQVLGNLLRRQQLSDGQLKKVLEAAGRIGSDHYKLQVLKTALETPSTNEGTLLAILGAAGSIDSDHYLTELLVALSDQVRNGSAALKDAYRATARQISSETYYGRALRAID